MSTHTRDLCMFWYTGGVSIEGDSDSWDFGTGAGFYLDATEAKWAKHYRMYSYIVKELPHLVYEQLPIVSDLYGKNVQSMVKLSAMYLGRISCFCDGPFYGKMCAAKKSGLLEC